jgi:hypothetical protein
MLDRIPAWARHLAIVFFAVAITVITKAIAASGGASGVHWHTVLWAAIDAGIAAVSAVVALWATPLTGQYGLDHASDKALRIR